MNGLQVELGSAFANINSRNIPHIEYVATRWKWSKGHFKNERTQTWNLEEIVEKKSRLVVGASFSLFAFSSRVRGPQRQVVPQQLHDEGAVLIAVLIQGVQLGNRIVESLKSENLPLEQDGGGEISKVAKKDTLIPPVLPADKPCQGC